MILINSLYAQSGIIPFAETCDFFSESPEGVLFLSTTHQAYTFDGNQLNQKIVSHKGSPNIQSEFYFDDSNRIWFCTYEALICFDRKKNTSRVFQIRDGQNKILNSDYYCFGWSHRYKRLWLKQNNDIYTFDIDSSKFRKVSNNISGKRIKKDKNSDRFFSYYYTYNPLILYQSTDSSEITKVYEWKNWPAKVLLQDIIIMEDGKILMLTDRGLFVGDSESKDIKEILWKNQTIYRFLCGIQLNKTKILASTKEKGLITLQFNNDYKLIELVQLPWMDLKNPVQRMFKSINGFVFMSSYKNFIASFYSGSEHFRHYKFHSFEAQTAIVLDQKIRIYDNRSKAYELNQAGQWTLKHSNEIAQIKKQLLNTQFTNTTLYNTQSIHFRLFSEQNNQFNNINSDMIYRFFQSDNGNYFISTINGILLKKGRNHWQTLNLQNPEKKVYNYVGSLQDKYLITALNQDVIRIFDYKNLEVLLKEIPFVGDLYNQVFDSVRARLYFSSSVGLISLDLHNFDLKILDETNLSKDKSCNCIVRDNRGKIWGSRSNTLFCYNPVNQTFENFPFRTSYETSNYLPGVCGKITHDSLYFVSSNTLTTFKPESISERCVKPKVYLNNLIINYQACQSEDTLLSLDKLELPYDMNTLGFSVNAVDFISDKQTQLKYFIEPMETSWNTIQDFTKEINYIKLRPGNYIFHYKSAYLNSNCESDSYSLPIKILPPYWMTWWFRFGLIFILLSIGYGIIRSYYNRQLEKKDLALREQKLIIDRQQALEKERNRIAAEMHDDLGSGLTIIRYLSDKAMKTANTEEEKLQIGKIALQSKNLIRNMSEIIWALNTRNDTFTGLIAFIRRNASEFFEEQNIKLDWKQEDISDKLNITGESRRNIHLSMKEVFHNIVKHAKASQVQIQVYWKLDFLYISIKDNGIGIDLSNKPEAGNGLQNIQNRMKQLKGQCIVNGNNTGTEVILFFPVSQIS